MSNIRDVAKKAGVSVTTVSRVLNNTGYVNIKTRNKVLKAIKELDYHPNEMARAFSRQKSHLIGLIIPNAAHPFFAEVIRNVEFYAYKNGYKILVCSSMSNVNKEVEYLDMLKQHQVDGIIMASQNTDIENYKNINLPIVAIDRKLSDNIPYVSSDNYGGGVMATNYLIELGCKNIIHISGNLKIDMKSNDRCLGFEEICKRNNINYKIFEVEASLIENFDYDDIVQKILIENPETDGVFASADLIAAAVIRTCSQLGKKIPKDMKVIGFDDTIIASVMQPPITTIRQPIESICNYAVTSILNQLEGNIVPNKTELPVTLIKRRTT